MRYAYTLIGGASRGSPANNKRTLRMAGALAVALSLTSLLLLYSHAQLSTESSWRSTSHSDADADSETCRFTHAPTRHLGGEPGFQVFENVGYFNRTFYFFGQGQELPQVSTIMSGTTVGVANASFRPDICLDGTTLLTNEGSDGSWSGLWHYYHFALENILGGFAGGADVDSTPLMPKRLAIPWDAAWHDKWGMNDAIVTAIFGNQVINKDEWSRLSDDWLFFEKLIFVDRWAAHRSSPLVEVWFKMPVQMFETVISKHITGFWDTARSRVWEYFQVPVNPKRRIAYIDRQSTNRKLPPEQHEQLLEEMNVLVEANDNVEFVHLILENMKPDEQFREVSQANVLLGVHGNGLTHLLWLPPSSAVIELFPAKVFQRDYQTAAAALGHNYTAIAGSAIVLQEEWEADPGNKNGDDLHNGKAVDVSIPLIVQHVAAALHAMP